MSRPQEEFVRIQQYEGHLRRLIKVKQRNAALTKASTSVFKTNQNHNQSLPIRKRRVQTENNQISKGELKINTRSNNLLPLPLIPQSQRQLLSNSLNDRKLLGRQAEIILENYLLSRRILNAKSCIKNSNLKKFYQNQQKYSILRSKSRLSQLHSSQSRLQKFKQFETSQMIENLRDSSTMGSGRFVFSLKIQQMQRIIRQNSEGKLYNLIIKFNKKSLKFTNLTYKNLTQHHRFNFRKRETNASQELTVQIECIVQNNIIKFGSFVIDVNDPFNQIKNLSKGQSFSYEKQNEIEGIRSIRSDRLIGTVVFDYNIATESGNQLL